MIRLILVFLIFGIFLAFIIFNLENSCDVSLGFFTFTGIPVFLTAIFSFLFGMLFAIPLVASLFFKKRKKSSPETPTIAKDTSFPKHETLKKTDDSHGIE